MDILLVGEKIILMLVIITMLGVDIAKNGKGWFGLNTKDIMKLDIGTTKLEHGILNGDLDTTGLTIGISMISVTNRYLYLCIG